LAIINNDGREALQMEGVFKKEATEMSTKEKGYLLGFQEISRAISSTLAMDEVLALIVKKMVKIMNLKGSTIRLVNPRTNTMDLVASAGLSKKYLEKGLVGTDKSITEALTGRPVAIYDASTDTRMQYPQEAKEEGIASLLAIPMLVKGRVIGVMRLLTPEPRDFLMDEVEFACAVAELGGQAILNAQLYETRLKELEFLKAVQQVSMAINSTLDLQKVLTLLVKTATTALDIKAAAVRLLDEKRKKMELVASYGLSDRYINKGPVEADKSIAETMTGKPVSIYDVRTDPQAQYPEAAAEEGISSILSIPISLKTHIIGVLRIYTRTSREFSVEEISFVSTLAEQAALAMENARMYQKLKGEYEAMTSDMYSFSDYTRGL
jgi:signal transduction protein with GAF and PtsI domain